MQELLKEKKAQKARNPTFTRTDNHKKGKLGNAWRKPKGWQNKMRLEKKGYKRIVKPGHGTPATLRGADDKGLKIVTVNTIKELQAIDQKTQSALIANVGRKKKIALIAEAQKLGITITNLSVKKYQEKTAAFLKEKAEKKMAQKEKEAAKKQQEKAAEQKKDEEKKAAAEAAKKAEEPATTEDEKAEQKKELDKVLTSKKGM